jgi:hypothetical protein
MKRPFPLMEWSPDSTGSEYLKAAYS